jgi:hypothetical protein
MTDIRKHFVEMFYMISLTKVIVYRLGLLVVDGRWYCMTVVGFGNEKS